MDLLENLSDPFAVGIPKRNRGSYFGAKAGAGSPGGPGDADGIGWSPCRVERV